MVKVAPLVACPADESSLTDTDHAPTDQLPRLRAPMMIQESLQGKKTRCPKCKAMLGAERANPGVKQTQANKKTVNLPGPADLSRDEADVLPTRSVLLPMLLFGGGAMVAIAAILILLLWARHEGGSPVTKADQGSATPTNEEPHGDIAIPGIGEHAVHGDLVIEVVIAAVEHVPLMSLRSVTVSENPLLAMRLIMVNRNRGSKN